MKPCRLCDRAIDQSPPLIGSRAYITKFMFVLHKPDSRISGGLFDGEINYDVALGLSKTGKELRLLLNYCKLDSEDVYITNFFKCTLPQDQNPGAKEYRNCIKRLEEQIEEFNPNKIVFFSKFIEKYIPEISKPHLVIAHPSRIWALRRKGTREAEYEKVRSFLYG